MNSQLNNAINNINISIIISTWNRADHIANLLDILTRQTYNSKYEIIIVDSHSQDNTLNTIEKYLIQYNYISHIHVDNSLTKKRNAGYKAAKYDWLLFLDDDIEIDNTDFLLEVSNFNISSQIIYSGLIMYPTQWVFSSCYYKYRNSRHYHSFNNGNVDVPLWSFVAMFFLICKDDYNSIGLFNEFFNNYGGEDHDFEFRSRKLGYKHKFMKSAVAIHREGKTGILNFSNKIAKSSSMYTFFLKFNRDYIKFYIIIIYFFSIKLNRNLTVIRSVIFLQNLLIKFLEKYDGFTKLNLNFFYKILVIISISRGFLTKKNGSSFYD